MRLKDAGVGAPNMIAGFPESMSDGFDQLPPEPGHMRPDPCTDQHGWPICVPAQRRLETVHTHLFLSWNRYLSLPPTIQDLTQGQWPEGWLKVRIRGGEGLARAEARTLQDFAGHRLAQCNMSLMSLAGNESKHWSRHRCLIITWTWPRSPVLYLLVTWKWPSQIGMSLGRWLPSLYWGQLLLLC